MNEQNHHYRDGDEALYRRNTNPVWQMRFKNPDTAGWIRKSTEQRTIDDAARWVCDDDDETRFKTKHGLAAETRTFAQVHKMHLASDHASYRSPVANRARLIMAKTRVYGGFGSALVGESGQI